MCSIGTNSTADQQLTSLGDKKQIEKKLLNFADDSDIGRPGYLDQPVHHLRGMPQELRHIRRLRSGRHRIFYTGDFNQCSYNVFFVKLFKKKGTEDEHDPQFHKTLGRVVDDPQVRTIPEPESE